MAGPVTARWLLLLAVAVSAAAATAVSASGKHERWRMSGRVGGRVVEKERRRVVAEAEAGTVTAVDVADAAGTAYRLHFITMDAGALFLPVQLHADMVFYVHSGRGKVTYIEEESGERSSLELERGDVYNLEQGSIMFIQSYPNATRQRLRIYAIFTSEGINAEDPSKPKVEAYSRVSSLLTGFETRVLRLGFGVQREVAEAIKSAKIPPPIIPYNPKEKGDEEKPNWTEDIVDALLGVRDPEEFLNKKKDKHKKKEKGKKSKSKAFNFYSGKPDVQNCYGWSRTMTNKDLDALHGSDIGMSMVNLTTGSMVGPHWNPKATEIAIVTEGTGIVQTVCPSSSNASGESRRGHRGDERGRPGGRGDEEGQGGVRCRNTVFRVKEGDVFVVPRFHPMAQMSFNNDSFVFVGFSTHMGQNHPQFLAGKGSVLQAIGKEVLALSLCQENSTAVGKLLSAQRDSTILSCISCAEELEEKAVEEEEGGGKGPGEREEEKERREREEEERRKEQEKERREREEEERKREQEEKERKEEEERQRRKEEEERRKEEEKEKREREEEERKREQEEREPEEERKREQEEREPEEEEERQRRKEEERERREQEEKQRREEEEERWREEEEGGGGHGVEPENDEPPLYRLSKKLKKRYRAGTYKSG